MQTTVVDDPRPINGEGGAVIRRSAESVRATRWDNQLTRERGSKIVVWRSRHHRGKICSITKIWEVDRRDERGANKLQGWHVGHAWQPRVRSIDAHGKAGPGHWGDASSQSQVQATKKYCAGKLDFNNSFDCKCVNLKVLSFAQLSVRNHQSLSTGQKRKRVRIWQLRNFKFSIHLNWNRFQEGS